MHGLPRFVYLEAKLKMSRPDTVFSTNNITIAANSGSALQEENRNLRDDLIAVQEEMRGIRVSSDARIAEIDLASALVTNPKKIYELSRKKKTR